MINIIKQFDFEGTLQSYKPTGNGHINDTFLVDCGTHKYVTQRINHHIFTKPLALMENVALVTAHIRDVVAQQGGDVEREVLQIIKTKEGNSLTQDNDGYYWRSYQFIDDAMSLDLVENPDDFYESGYAFGNFQAQLADFPVASLNFTIDDFHNTPVRFKAFSDSVSRDAAGRVESVKKDIDFFIEREAFMSSLWDLHEQGLLPLKVTHNDTKLNNVMLDNKTGKGICVVDLDTVMPGFSVDDFGDAIRFGASTALEDEKDLDKVSFDLNLYDVFTKGFIKGGAGTFTDIELDNFAVGAKMMALECGMRFLTDYLNGDTYFKTAYDDHNLVRARTQMKLVADMESNWDAMNAIVGKYK
ncbi:aminoglycoside phosphotransferase family protein [Erysipelothrix sp. HDW6C]|uniref:phosphotransferase enzyme family protein n=1 Tax=Erysipelothrix sp. HDW6C TaxID=2714930 RepID=UPI00140BFC6D|nr:aminoglycoside phosphotransferase family protein [Erysipelothrix sp. HDW6C]QIK70112.1 aminoglycoside phosphotransferase family protein [Erysipelothrix sp. HDW6C]